MQLPPSAYSNLLLNHLLFNSLLLLLLVSFSESDSASSGSKTYSAVELDGGTTTTTFSYTPSNVHQVAANILLSCGLCSASLPIVDCEALHLLFASIIQNDHDLITFDLSSSPRSCTTTEGALLPSTLSPVLSPSSASPSRSDLSRVSLLWEMLTALQLSLHPAPPSGRIRPVQLVSILAALDAAGPAALYCEVGLNGGHSAGAVLAARSSASVLSFDIGEFPFSEPVADFLAFAFPGRFEVVWGDSKATVPARRTVEGGKKCDVIFVDGGHQVEDVAADIVNLKELAHSTTALFLDDTQPAHTLSSLWSTFVRVAPTYANLGFPGTGARAAITEAIASGLIDGGMVFNDYGVDDPCNPEVGGVRFVWGWAEGKFKW